MPGTRIRLALPLLALLAAAAVAAPAAAAEPAHDPDVSSAPAHSAGCASTLPELLAPAPVTAVAGRPAAAPLLDPLPQVLQPHCCSQFQVDQCRDDCKAQGPGCKGQITCRAGECVCTCSCP